MSPPLDTGGIKRIGDVWNRIGELATASGVGLAVHYDCLGAVHTQAQLPGLARAIVLVFIAILGAGGLLLFTVPIGWLRKLGEVQKSQVLDSLAVPIEDIQDALLHPDRYSADDLTKRSSTLDMALKLRQEISAASPVPLPQLVTRGASTLAFPMLLTVLQIVVTKAI